MKRTEIKAIAPLQCWDIFAEHLVERAADLRKASDLAELEYFKSKYKWSFDTASLSKENYTTIVVTDSDQMIEWVNPGFKEMTGYPKSYAIGKHPRFLQGNKTSITTKEEIRNTLALKKPVSKQLLNYRKDGTPYLCDIKIIPLFNTNQEVSHFLALERKSRVA